jgi:ferric-dicitrate binding protein FerR (iron transport regulator)
VNRYAEIPLVIQDDRLRSHLLSGRVRAGDVETFLAILREQFAIEATSSEGRIALRTRSGG